MKRQVIEDVGIIGGLIGVQFAYAGNSILQSYLMSVGLNPFTIIIFSTFAAFLILSPITFYFERSKWPKKFSFKLLIQLLLIAFGGVTLFQSLLLKGIKLTSPAMATAMPNLAPGLIFLIAWTLRLGKVKLSCTYSKVKIVGTMVCVGGALTMSIMHSAATSATASEPSLITSTPPTHNILFDGHKIVGCLYLFAAVFVLSTNVALQAATLKEFPAPMSLCAVTSLIGVFVTVAVQLLQDRRLETGRPLLTISDLIVFSLLGGTVSGACVSFNGWAMKKRGPVLVSMFCPVGTLCSVLLSVFTLGDTITVGSKGCAVLRVCCSCLRGCILWYGPKAKRVTMGGETWMAMALGLQVSSMHDMLLFVEFFNLDIIPGAYQSWPSASAKDRSKAE